MVASVADAVAAAHRESLLSIIFGAICKALVAAVADDIKVAQLGSLQRIVNTEHESFIAFVTVAPLAA